MARNKCKGLLCKLGCSFISNFEGNRMDKNLSLEMWVQQLRKVNRGQKSWGLAEFLHLCGMRRPWRVFMPNSLPPSHDCGNSLPTYLFSLGVSSPVENIWCLLSFFFSSFCLLGFCLPEDINLLQTCPRAFMELFVLRLRGMQICGFLWWESQVLVSYQLLFSPQRGESEGWCLSLTEPWLFWSGSYCRA